MECELLVKNDKGGGSGEEEGNWGGGGWMVGCLFMARSVAGKAGCIYILSGRARGLSVKDEYA